MPAGITDDDAIVRYLLGKLDEAERSAFEDRLVSHNSLFEQVEATEGELLDAYACGELSVIDRAALERGVLASPEGRMRLAFARALMTRTSESNRELAAVGNVLSPGKGVAPWIGSRPTLMFATAAAVLAILAIVTWIAVDRSRSPVQPEQTRREPAANANVNAQEPPRDAYPGNLPQDVNANERERKAPAPQGKDELPSSMIAFAFAAQTTRGVEELRVLTVPPSASTVRLQLEFLSSGRGPYTAVLRTAAGAAVLRRPGLRAQRRHESSRVTVDIPIDRLAEDEYELALIGSGSDDVVADYQFRVVRK